MILSHALNRSLLAEAGAPSAAAAAVVQTGAAGMHMNSAVLWRDTATSEQPPPLKRSRLLHHSSPDDVLAAFSEINDVEVGRTSEAAGQSANLWESRTLWLIIKRSSLHITWKYQVICGSDVGFYSQYCHRLL